MIDLEAVDRMFDTSQELGQPIRFALFDKRVLMPFSDLPGAVAAEAGEHLTEEELRARAEEGWFPVLPRADADGADEGVPLYVPSRIGVLLKLSSEGWEPEELRVVAELEEWAVDNLLSVDDMLYTDDDVETLVLHVEERILSLETSGLAGIERDEELTKARRELEFLRRLAANGVPAHLEMAVKRSAFRTRALNDSVRLFLCEMDRQKTAAGYSPFVSFSSHGWSQEGGFRAGPILWPETLRAAAAHGVSDSGAPLRVPGFLMKGDRVVPTRTLRPSEYSSLWKERDIEGYLAAWASLSGERRCLNCFEALPEGADVRKRFCGDKCRNAAKQRRFRERNPQAVEMTQKRYWDSVELT